MVTVSQPHQTSEQISRLDTCLNSTFKSRYYFSNTGKYSFINSPELFGLGDLSYNIDVQPRTNTDSKLASYINSNTASPRQLIGTFCPAELYLILMIYKPHVGLQLSSLEITPPLPLHHNRHLHTHLTSTLTSTLTTTILQPPYHSHYRHRRHFLLPSSSSAC